MLVEDEDGWGTLTCGEENPVTGMSCMLPLGHVPANVHSPYKKGGDTWTT